MWVSLHGKRALWRVLKKYLENAAYTLPLLHVVEGLWAVVAHCFHPEGSDEAACFVTARFGRILEIP